jgi:hypothetical protein
VDVTVFTVIITIAHARKDVFLSLNVWLFDGISRDNSTLESLVFALFKVFLTQHPDAAKMITVERCDALSMGIMQKLIDSNNVLRGNSAEILDRCRGRNERIDFVHFVDDCHPEYDERMGPFHKTYDCVSLDRGIEFLRVLVADMLQAPQNVKLAPEEEFFQAFRLMNDDLIDKAYEAAEILPSLARADIDSFQVLISAMSFGGITVFPFSIRKLDTDFDGALRLLRHLPPREPVFAFVPAEQGAREAGGPDGCLQIRDNQSKGRRCMPQPQRVHQGRQQVSAVARWVYTRAAPRPAARLDSRIPNSPGRTLVQKGEASLTFQTHCVGTTDDEQSIPVSCIVLGIASDEKMPMPIRDIDNGRSIRISLSTSRNRKAKCKSRNANRMSMANVRERQGHRQERQNSWQNRRNNQNRP